MTLGALMVTGATYLNPALVAERLVDCIGGESVVAREPAVGTAPTVAVGEVLGGFQSPTAVIASPDGDLLVAERRGVLTSIEQMDDQRREVVDISELVDGTAEGGLLSVALHPKFGVGGESRIFAVFTRLPDRALTVASLELSEEPTAVKKSLRVLQVIPREYGWHAGGGAVFLPDGRLLVGVGDDSKPNEAQSPSSMLGKLVAFDVDNPAQGGTIYASGLRNPFRLTTDAARGMLWVADVGQFCVEEVNRIALADAEGANFGWPRYEGSRVWPRYVSSDFGYGDGDRGKDKLGGPTFTAPLTSYLHVMGGPCAVIGGAVVGEWYLFADYCDGILRGIPVDAALGTKAVELINLNRDALSIGVIGVLNDGAGRTWVLDGWGGSLIKLDITL